MPRPSPSRRGFTLVELLVVIVLLGLVMATLSRVIVRQQRFYRGANEILDTRSQIRQAASILPLELRGLSSSGGDIAAMEPMRVEFRSNVGTSVVCAKAGSQVTLPPAQLASGTVLTSFLSRPVVGDTIFLYDEGPEMGGSDDQWQAHRITALDSSLAACPTTSRFTTAGDALKYRYQVTLSPAPTATTQLGAPIRFGRKVRYRLYQAADTRWYLGYEQYTNGSWGGMQPVSGPYRPADAATPGNSGVQFRYYDDAGAELTGLANATRVARIDVFVRGQSQSAVALTGDQASTFRDSLAVTVAVRNRN